MIWQPTNRTAESLGITAPTKWNYSGSRVNTYSMTADAMASLDFAEIAKLSMQTNMYFYIVDVAAYTDVVIFTNQDKYGVNLCRMGMGFRIGFAAWNLGVESSLNLGAVAAAVSVKAASSNLEIQVFAGDVLQIPGLNNIKDLSSGTVDAEFIRQLASYAALLTSGLAKSGGAIPPTPVKMVQLDSVAFRPSYAAEANRFAIEAIRRTRAGTYLPAWVGAGHDGWRNQIEPVIVAAAYNSFGIENWTDVPDKDQVAAANAMQPLGW